MKAQYFKLVPITENELDLNHPIVAVSDMHQDTLNESVRELSCDFAIRQMEGTVSIYNFRRLLPDKR